MMALASPRSWTIAVFFFTLPALVCLVRHSDQGFSPLLALDAFLLQEAQPTQEVVAASLGPFLPSTPATGASTTSSGSA